MKSYPKPKSASFQLKKRVFELHLIEKKMGKIQRQKKETKNSSSSNWPSNIGSLKCFNMG